jgi:dipeptidyl aminopeptidase/acylaminoacyl peptidase
MVQICVVLLSGGVLVAQPDSERLVKAIEKNGCVVLRASQVRICRYDYQVDNRSVEALSFQPPGEGQFPGVLLIPGHMHTAKDLIQMGNVLAGLGFACLAVTPPGYGKSKGPRDFVGPKTIAVLTAGYRKFQQEPFVDENRMGIYGYSRGGMAASLLAVQLPDARAAVFGAGIYDFRKAFEETRIEGIRDIMRSETGMSRKAIEERSSILQMEKLNCPVLILHGEKDERVPVSQAIMLRDRLTSLGKEFEIRLFPNSGHEMGPEVRILTVEFFRRRLK